MQRKFMELKNSLVVVFIQSQGFYFHKNFSCGIEYLSTHIVFNPDNCLNM